MGLPDPFYVLQELPLSKSLWKKNTERHKHPSCKSTRPSAEGTVAWNKFKARLEIQKQNYDISAKANRSSLNMHNITVILT